MSRLLIATLACTASALLCAQTRRPAAVKPPAPPKVTILARVPLAKISFTGLKNIPEAQALRWTGLKLGQLAGKAEFDAARDRLLESGWVESVAYASEPLAAAGGSQQSQAQQVRFDIAEVNQLYGFLLEELPLDDAKARQHLEKSLGYLPAKIPATPLVLGGWRPHCRNWYRRSQPWWAN